MIGRQAPDYIGNYGASIYEPRDLNKLPMHLIGVLQVPYSLFDRRFGPYFANWKAEGIEIHVRSVFLQGKILEKVKPHEAIAFCLMNPYVDKVIIGVDSLEQLKDDLRYFHRLNELKVTNEKIIDPRKWNN
jgi:aryl-alcohol dehydrogenase-like predicted oxidoreductase